LHYQFNSINYEQPITISPEGKPHPQQRIQNQQLMAIEIMNPYEACLAIQEDVRCLFRAIPRRVLDLDSDLNGADVGCLLTNIDECAQRIIEVQYKSTLCDDHDLKMKSLPHFHEIK
jgi:hypothetical protein